MKNVTKLIIKWHKLILLAIVAMTVWSVITIKNNIYLETDLDEYMPKDHPSFASSDEAEEMFDVRDAILIAIENKDGIYNSQSLKKIKDLSKALAKMKEVSKDDITSLYNADNIRGDEEGLVIEEFFKRIPQTKEGLDKLRADVRSNNMVYKRIVSEDETTALIYTKITDGSFTQDFYNRINELTESFNGDGDKLYVAGQPIIEGTMANLMPKDMGKMVPIVILLIILVLMVVFRSIKSTMFTLMVVVLSTIWTFGVMAAFNIPIYAITTLIPVMLIAIGVADGIHMLSHMQLFKRSHHNATKSEVIQNMNNEMWSPVVMTSVTTSVGFLSLLTSDVGPIQYFAVFAALGVFFAMFLSLVFLPAALSLFGLPRIKISESPENDFFNVYAKKFSDFVLKYPKILIFNTLLILVFFGYGMSKLWINSSFLERFPTDNAIVKTDAFVNSKFMGTTSINVILKGKKDDFKRPEVLRMADKLVAETDEKFDLVGGSMSINDFLKRMNVVLNEDRAEYDRIPDDNDLIAQYFLLYEMSGGDDKIWDFVDQDFKTGNYTFQLKSDNSKGLTEVIDHLSTYKDDFKSVGINLDFAGSGYKLLVFNDLILQGQIKSLIMSLFIVIILLAFMFKSIKIGFIGSIPIIITSVISFGVLGWLNIPLETTTALISSIAIGIGIDYAVHFIDRYKINAERTGDRELTVQKTMAHSGRAISFNAIVVIAGFLVLLMSVFNPNKVLGAIVSLNMLTSFIGTVSIMFLMLYMSKVFFKK